MKEQWRAVASFTDYQVSNHGRVMSLKYGKQRLRSLVPNSNGFLQVRLHRQGVSENLLVSHVVYDTFKPGRRLGRNLISLDRDHTNCSLLNLRPATVLERVKFHRELDSFTGRLLTQELADEIRRLSEGNWTIRDLAREFGVSGTTVQKVLSGATWKS